MVNGNLGKNSRNNLLACFRAAPLHSLMSAAALVGREAASNPNANSADDSSAFTPYRHAWGPSYDGVVVHSFRHRMRDYLERMARYELLFGVATADALLLFNEKQVQFGTW